MEVGDGMSRLTIGEPPLGCAPAYVRSGERIKELADAISRASDEAQNYPGHITKWAQEIIAQCDIIKNFAP